MCCWTCRSDRRNRFGIGWDRGIGMGSWRCRAMTSSGKKMTFHTHLLHVLRIFTYITGSLRGTCWQIFHTLSIWDSFPWKIYENHWTSPEDGDFPWFFLDRAPTWPWSHAWPSQCRSPDAWPSPRCCCCCCRFCPLVITCLRTRVISHIIDGTSG